MKSLYINGQWQEASFGSSIDVINSADEKVLVSVPSASQSDVDQAVKAAKNAFPKWNALALEERLAYLEKICQGILNRQEEIIETIIQELGSAKKFVADSHLPLSINEILASIEDAKEISWEEEIDGSTIIREGYGVVACITPWNFPLNQIQRKITPALIAGNTVVVKPSSLTPLTAIIYAEIIDQAGLPDGVFNLITGSGSRTGDYLAGHKDVDVISFTGSTQVGQALYQKAGTSIKQLVLELGGKSALIYLKGGDRKLAIKKAMDSCLNNQGQTCSALTRLLVPQDEYEEVKEEILDYYKERVLIGDPTKEETTVGPMVSAEQRRTVLNYIQQGKDEGAKLLIGGSIIDGPGYFIEPAVFVNATNEMTIAQEEIFGPVLTLLTYESVEEAIEMANDSKYGLSGAVVGPLDEAIEVARQIKTGNILINGASASPKTPFGGYKQSGLGREKGKFGIEDYLETKAIIK